MLRGDRNQNCTTCGDSITSGTTAGILRPCVPLPPGLACHRYLISEPTLEPLKGHAGFRALLETRHEEWLRDLGRLNKVLPNEIGRPLPTPSEFLGE